MWKTNKNNLGNKIKNQCGKEIKTIHLMKLKVNVKRNCKLKTISFKKIENQNENKQVI